MTNTTLYIDEFRNIHMQGELLGMGGQGHVYRTKDPNLALKLVTDQYGEAISNKDELQKYSTRIKWIRLLPLPKNLNISIPIAQLENTAGYIMPLLSGMVAFNHFKPEGKAMQNIHREDIPSWLSDMDFEGAKKIVHYYTSGGLRRRLFALYKCASILARLHANGFIYGDISPNNAFISQNLDETAVWLIDADNIRFEVLSGGSIVYTPQYGAPELVQGKDCARPSSDCYAFAVMAFYLLSLLHPFDGKLHNEEDGDDWASVDEYSSSNEDKAFEGLFPWVDDPNDTSNASESGLPRVLLLTEELQMLFRHTFEEGRTNPHLRPTMLQWPRALAKAVDQTVLCPQCHMTYYTDKTSEQGFDCCPYCEEKTPPIILCEAYYWHGEKDLGDVCWHYVHELHDGEEIFMPSRLFEDFTMQTSDKPELSLSRTGNELLLKKCETTNLDFSVGMESAPQGHLKPLSSQMKIKMTSKDRSFWLLVHHTTAPRLLRCSLIGGM